MSRYKFIPWAAAAVATPIAFSGTNPIMIPDKTWEETAAYEPTVIYEGGVFKMWYGGGWNNPGIGYATSSDGSVWTKNSSPVIGQGGSGVSGKAARNCVFKDGSTYYCYYADAAATGANIKQATSTDGQSWTVTGTVLASNALAGVDGWANSSVWKEGATWYMLAEGHFSSGTQWKIFLLTSSNGTSWTFQNSSNPLTSLQIPGGGMWGGPNMAAKIGSTYHLYYHASPTSGASIPTNIYHATSTDLINWTRDGSPVLTYQGTGFENDQVADPCVIEVSGRVYMFYDGDDNSASSGSLGVAYYDGTIAGGGTFTRLAGPDYSNPIEKWAMHEASGTRAGANGHDLTDNGGCGSASGGPGSTVFATMTGTQTLSRNSEAAIQLGNFNWTFCGWFNTSNNTTYPVILTKYTGGSQTQLYVYVESSVGNKVRAIVYSNLTGTSWHDVYSNAFGGVSNNTWIFVEIYHDADTNKIGVSVNAGTRNTTTHAEGIWPTGSAPLRFGGDGSTNAATRRMERWRFYKRLLTTTELSNLYNSGNGTD